MRNPGWEDLWRSEQFPGRYSSFAPPNETVVEWAARLPKSAAVVDVGCGAGRHVIYLGQRGFRMAGCDIAPSGVQRAYAACADRGLAFDGQVCAMTALPWPDAVFEAALSTSTLHHGLRLEIQRALGEIWRVLKPGGELLVDFPCTDTWDYQRLRESTANGRVVEVEPNTFVDQRAEPEESDGYLPHHYCDEAEMRALLQRFTVLRLWPALKPAQPEANHGLSGKWVAWAQKPPSPSP